jgi:hypothetical protein
VPLLLADALAAGEGQSIEFKESLKLEKEGMQAAVAFANARGGDLFIGVRDKGLTPTGVDIGANTLEELANAFERHIYPSLPVEVDSIRLDTGRHVVHVSVPQDVPPLVGAYLFSDATIDPFAGVAASGLQAFRRVGRTSQKIDFMLLREPRSTDPMILVTASGFSGGGESPLSFSAVAFLPDDSGIAHQVQLRLEPLLAPPSAIYETLPRSDRQRSFAPTFTFVTPKDRSPAGVWLIAKCKDDWGCTWEYRQWIPLPGGRDDSATPVQDSHRRIVKFPPKRRFAGP